jgi:hypothetical protein
MYVSKFDTHLVHSKDFVTKKIPSQMTPCVKILCPYSAMSILRVLRVISRNMILLLGLLP